MAEVTMPRLSDTMTEGSVGRWLKQPGDRVEKGDIIAEIETDKATMELEAFESGTLQKIMVKEGQVVPIGEPIAMIGEGALKEAAAQPAKGAAPSSEEGGAAATNRTTEESQRSAQQPATTPQPTPAKATTTAQPPAQGQRTNGQVSDDRIKASPLARRMAEEKGIDLRLIQGTGPGGRIIKENVEDFQPGQAPKAAPAQPRTAATPAAAPEAQPTPTAAPAGEVVPLSRMRRAIARAMTEAKPGTPHIYVTIEIDMAAAMELRKQIIDSGAAEVKISINDLVIKAAAKALHKFPRLNSSYANGTDGQPGIITHQQINVSVAVALEDGLVAPVIKDADKKSLGVIAAEVRDLAGRSREGKIKQTELEGATFQVSNLGMFDVVEFVSVITPPQAASLAVGAVRQVPTVRDGQVLVGEVMNVTLSVDHRVSDGATAAQYLQEFKRLLQTPLSLLT